MQCLLTLIAIMPNSKPRNYESSKTCYHYDPRGTAIRQPSYLVGKVSNADVKERQVLHLDDITDHYLDLGLKRGALKQKIGS